MDLRLFPVSKVMETLKDICNTFWPNLMLRSRFWNKITMVSTLKSVFTSCTTTRTEDKMLTIPANPDIVYKILDHQYQTKDQW